MITISKILWSGGACPYQIEAITDGGKYFYLRYRGGRLCFGVWESSEECDHANYQFRKTIGGELDGWADHSIITKELDGLVTFPDGFVHSFEGVKTNDSADSWFLNKEETEKELRKMFGIDTD